MRLSKENALEDKAGVLKSAYSALTKRQRDIEHVKTWSELPNSVASTKQNLDTFMLAIAQDVDKFNTEIQSAKGILKGRTSK